MRLHSIAVGCALAGVAVVLGAFGAHALKGSLGADEIEVWRTAVQYQMGHALGMVLHGLFRERREVKDAPAWCFFLGSVVFSGSLYALALGAPRGVGMVTPVGGVLFIVGWGVFAVQAVRSRRS
jgi:uncharacterized membrane protein YgdD (TMEM256/DUF423 family)